MLAQGEHGHGGGTRCGDYCDRYFPDEETAPERGRAGLQRDLCGFKALVVSWAPFSYININIDTHIHVHMHIHVTLCNGRGIKANTQYRILKHFL